MINKGESSNLSQKNFSFKKYSTSEEEFDEVTGDTIYIKDLINSFIRINEFK